MKLEIDITDLCNYDGSCLLSDYNSEEHGYAWCYGNRFGCEECPLKDKIAIIEVKEEEKKK